MVYGSTSAVWVTLLDGNSLVMSGKRMAGSESSAGLAVLLGSLVGNKRCFCKKNGE